MCGNLSTLNQKCLSIGGTVVFYLKILQNKNMFDMYAKKFAEYNSDEIDQMIDDLQNDLSALKTVNKLCKTKCEYQGDS
jgi:hypothetical protein